MIGSLYNCQIRFNKVDREALDRSKGETFDNLAY